MANIPSHLWYPTNLQERAAWHLNYSAQLAVVGPALGVLPAEIAQAQDDSTVMQFMAQVDVEFDAYGDGIRQYRNTITQGNVGDPTPDFPANPAFVLPQVVPTGIFRRLIDQVDRIRVSAAYSPDDGALLGIIPNGGGGPIPDSDLKPELKPTTQPGNVVEVRFTRGKTDGIEIEIKLDNDPNWENVGRFFKSPAVLIIPVGTGLPRAVQIRARYVEGNQPVGLNSETYNVVTTP